MTANGGSFKPGHKKIGGRRSGSKNRRSGLLKDILESNGFDLVSEIIETLGYIDDPNDRATQLMKLLPFVHPRLSAIEVTQKTPEQEEIEALTPFELERKVKQMLLGDTYNEAEKNKTPAALKP